VVLGVEADVSAADISGSGDCTLSFGQLTGLRSQCHTRLNSFGTIAGRLGVDYGRTLVFVKAGGAWGEFDRDVKSGLLALGPGGVVALSASHSDTRWGFVLGTGVEHALWRGWSAKVAYDFMDFSTQNETFRFTGPIFPPTGSQHIHADDTEQVHVVRFGLNYRFGEGSRGCSAEIASNFAVAPERQKISGPPPHGGPLYFVQSVTRWSHSCAGAGEV